MTFCASASNCVTSTFFPVSSGFDATSIRPRADAEGAHWFRVGVRLPFHKIIFDVLAEFIAKHISPVFPQCLTTRRSDEVHNDMLPTHPQRRREQSFAPLQKRILRIGEERHEGRDKTNSLLFRKRSVVAQPVRHDL